MLSLKPWDILVACTNAFSLQNIWLLAVTSLSNLLFNKRIKGIEEETTQST